MQRPAKKLQLQIRVSREQKERLRRAAKQAGMGMSEWVLSRALPPPAQQFERLHAALASAERPGFALAALGDFIGGLTAAEFEDATAQRPLQRLDAYWENYVAAVLELAAAAKGVAAPAWTREVPPLARPVFGSDLAGLRLHLLTHAPPPFRRRNIFVDSSIGDRV